MHVYLLLVAGFLLALAAGGWIADDVLPRWKRLDAWLGELARQKKD